MIPRPSRVWRNLALARHRQQPELEAEFAFKLLPAFRRCVSPGERLWVIDWQHAWYALDPHVAGPGVWPVRALPDGDSYNYVATDFRFGVVMGWRETGPVSLFGSQLLAAFDADPPERFIHACGPGDRD